MQCKMEKTKDGRMRGNVCECVCVLALYGLFSFHFVVIVVNGNIEPRHSFRRFVQTNIPRKSNEYTINNFNTNEPTTI